MRFNSRMSFKCEKNLTAEEENTGELAPLFQSLVRTTVVGWPEANGLCESDHATKIAVHGNWKFSDF